MIDKIKQIEINGVNYPIAFSMNVMENVQNEYGSMGNWTDALQPENKEPQIKDLIWTFQEFLNEGIDIENEENNGNRKPLSHKQVGRLLSNMNMADLGATIRDLTTQSIQTDPNAQTTQN